MDDHFWRPPTKNPPRTAGHPRLSRKVELYWLRSRHLLHILGQGELLGVVVAAGLAEDLGDLAVLPLEDVAGGLALQADQVLRAGHGLASVSGIAMDGSLAVAWRKRWCAATSAPGLSMWRAWPHPGMISR